MNGKKYLIGFPYAWNGIKEAWRKERNFRFHIVAMMLVFLAGITFSISAFEWMMVILSIGFVLVTELVNTTIEKFLDYVNPDMHPQAKVIKDISAGAVLVAAITAAIIGCIIFLPAIFGLIS